MYVWMDGGDGVCMDGWMVDIWMDGGDGVEGLGGGSLLVYSSPQKASLVRRVTALRRSE